MVENPTGRPYCDIVDIDKNRLVADIRKTIEIA